MVVGNGLMANAFRDFRNKKNVLIFASGVSNSTTDRSEEFERERDLLKKKITEHSKAKLIYFSSCDIANPAKNQAPYYRHKAKMEQFVMGNCASFTIFRLPQVVGKGGNPNTLMNFISDKIKNEKPFKAYKDTPKNILDSDHVVRMVNQIILLPIFDQCVLNLLNPNYYLIEEIIAAFEIHYQKKARFEWSDKSERFYYDEDLPEDFINSLPIDFSKDYLSRLVEKYFG